jgi:hypothetical protein
MTRIDEDPIVTPAVLCHRGDRLAAGTLRFPLYSDEHDAGGTPRGIRRRWAIFTVDNVSDILRIQPLASMNTGLHLDLAADYRFHCQLANVRLHDPICDVLLIDLLTAPNK